MKMKIKLNLPKMGLFLAFAIIGYQNITALLWQVPSGAESLVSLSMLIVSVISVYLLACVPIPRNSIALTLLIFYYYIIFTCLCNGYLPIFMQEPTLVFTLAFWIFDFWLFYSAAKRRVITSEVITKLSFLLTVICFALLCRYYMINMAQKNPLSGLNVVYYLIFMLPIVMMSTNKKIVNLGIVMNLIAVLLSGKRGALIAFAIPLLIWIQMNFREQHGRKKLYRLLLFVIIGVVSISVLSSFVDRLDLDIMDRMTSLFNGEDADGNGRTEIWAEYFAHMEQDGFLRNVIGRGYIATKRNPTLKALGMGWAHNDFLQILFDYGMFGFAIFCCVVMKLFTTYQAMRRNGYPLCGQFLCSVMIFIFCCSFSMVTIYPQWFLPMAAFWGFAIGDFECEQRKRFR